MSAFIIVILVFIGLFSLYKMVQNPLWGIALVFLVNPFEEFFPNLGSFTVGRILGLFTMLIWIIYLSSHRKLAQKLAASKLLKHLLIFLIPVFMSGVVWSFETDGVLAISSAFTFVLLGILALMLENIIETKSQLRTVAFAMAIASSFASIPAILYFVGIDLYTPIGADAPTDLTEETLRASTLGGNPNSLGIVARNGIFAAILLITLVKGKILRLSVWSMLLVCFAGMLLSGSRTNFYGTLILLTFIFGFGTFRYMKRKGQVIALAVGVLIVGYISFQLVPEPVKTRLLLGRGDERIAARTNERYEFTQGQQIESIEFLKSYPLFGVGLNRTYYESGYIFGAHDTVSAIVGETGILGTLGFLILLIWTFRTLLKALRKSRDMNSRIQISQLMGMMAAMIVMGVFGGLIMPYDRTFWMTLGLIYPIILISRRDVQKVQIHRKESNNLIRQNDSSVRKLPV